MAFDDSAFIEHLKVGLGNSPHCLVCDTKLSGSWTDYNGQMRCGTCGASYQVMGNHMEKNFLERHNLTEDDIAEQYCDCFHDIPVYRRYWQETHARVPAGWYFGPRPDDIKPFYQWMARNAETLRPQTEEYYDWDAIIKEFGE